MEKADTVYGVLGKEISWERAAKAFQEAFSEVLDLDLVAAPLTAKEINRARHLAQNQFGATEWTSGAQLNQLPT